MMVTSLPWKIHMTDPITVLTVNAIASLAFQEFIKSGAGELAKRFTAGAISKMKDLRGLIQQKLQGNPDAVVAMEQAQNGEEDEISGVATYLRAEMNKDPDFAAQVQMIVQEINAGKIPDNSGMVQNNSGNAIGFQTKVEGGTANIGLFGKIPNRE
jgi:hypothetical protein